MLNGLKWLDLGRVTDVEWTKMVGSRTGDRC